MNVTYIIRIHENSNRKGLKLIHIKDRLFKYLNKKKLKEHTQNNGNLNYRLRNGLEVLINPTNNGELLEMLVVGDADRLNKSVKALRDAYHPYPGYVSAIEFVKGNFYRISGTMDVTDYGFGGSTRSRSYNAEGSFGGLAGDQIILRYCILKVFGNTPKRAEFMLFPYNSVEKKD